MSAGADPLQPFARPYGEMDADAQMAKLERMGAASSRERKAGRCTHGWWQVRNPACGGQEQVAHLAPGQVMCLHCGEAFPTESAHAAAYKAALRRGGYNG